METNTTLKVVHSTNTLRVVHRHIIEEPHNDPAFEATELSAPSFENFRDTYEYFPDFGI